MPMTIAERPALGFIVEGHGEYRCYPSLYARIVGCQVRVPIVNAGGYGSVVKNIQRHLTDLFRGAKPLHVIITIDLKDVINDGIFKDCKCLCEHLSYEATDWLKKAVRDIRLPPLPEKISVVIQIPKFEAWLLSDVASLKRDGHIKADAPVIVDADGYQDDPCKYLNDNLCNEVDIKNPLVAKSLFSSVTPCDMRLASRSFNKFYREVLSFHKDWLTRCEVV